MDIILFQTKVFHLKMLEPLAAPTQPSAGCYHCSSCPLPHTRQGQPGCPDGWALSTAHDNLTQLAWSWQRNYFFCWWIWEVTISAEAQQQWWVAITSPLWGWGHISSSIQVGCGRNPASHSSPRETMTSSNLTLMLFKWVVFSF